MNVKYKNSDCLRLDVGITGIFGNVNISRNLRVRDEDDARDVSLGSNLQLPKIWL